MLTSDDVITDFSLSSYVDVVAVSTYDAWPTRDASNWNSTLYALDGAGGPRGLEQWRLFALSHSKPFAVGDWGLQNTDNVFYVQKMNEWFRKNAGTGAGKLLYEVRDRGERGE